MNLRALTRKPAKWPDKSALLASSHHRVDRTFMGTRVGAALQKTGSPGFNICMCWDTLESNPAAETVMFHAPPSPCCASACGQHPTLPGQVQKQREVFFFEKKVVKRCTEYTVLPTVYCKTVYWVPSSEKNNTIPEKFWWRYNTFWWWYNYFFHFWWWMHEQLYFLIVDVVLLRVHPSSV